MPDASRTVWDFFKSQNYTKLQKSSSPELYAHEVDQEKKKKHVYAATLMSNKYRLTSSKIKLTRKSSFKSV